MLAATASTGASATQSLLISNNDSEYFVDILLNFIKSNKPIIILLDALIGLDQESYTVNETDASVTVCVVFLMNSGIQDPILTAEATISATDGTAIGIVMCIMHTMS